MMMSISNWPFGSSELWQDLTRIRVNFAQLKFELLNCKTPCRLCGMTGLPEDYCQEKIISLEYIREESPMYSQVMAA